MDAGPSTSQERPAHIPPPVAVPDAVLRAIYGERGAAEKKAEFENSLRRWWATYAERKDDEDEYVADTLLYDKSHLPRCVLGSAFAVSGHSDALLCRPLTPCLCSRRTSGRPLHQSACGDQGRRHLQQRRRQKRNQKQGSKPGDSETSGCDRCSE